EKSQPALPSNSVYTIQIDRMGRVYVCTEKGLARLSQADGEWSALTFNLEDGLPSAECLYNAAMTDSAGRIWVGTAAGLAVVDPTLEPKGPPTPAPLVLERSLVRGQERELEGAALGYRENALQMEYALLSLFRG